MDLLKDNPEVWKLWSIGTFKDFVDNMFRLKKDLKGTGLRVITVIDQESNNETENPSGYAIFWPKTHAEQDEMEGLVSKYAVYHKSICTASALMS